MSRVSEREVLLLWRTVSAFRSGAHPRCAARGASGHEKIPVCGQLGPAVRSSEFPADGH
jgi:hypothetical protein